MVKFFCDCCGKELKKESDGYNLVIPIKTFVQCCGGKEGAVLSQICSGFDCQEVFFCYNCMIDLGELAYEQGTNGPLGKFMKFSQGLQKDYGLLFEILNYKTKAEEKLDNCNLKGSCFIAVEENRPYVKRYRPESMALPIGTILFKDVETCARCIEDVVLPYLGMENG